MMDGPDTKYKGLKDRKSSERKVITIIKKFNDGKEIIASITDSNVNILFNGLLQQGAKTLRRRTQ